MVLGIEPMRIMRRLDGQNALVSGWSIRSCLCKHHENSGLMKAVRRKPPGVLCTRFKSIKNVELIGNNEVVGIELLTEWGDFAAMSPGCLRSSA